MGMKGEARQGVGLYVKKEQGMERCDGKGWEEEWEGGNVLEAREKEVVIRNE